MTTPHARADRAADRAEDAAVAANRARTRLLGGVVIVGAIVFLIPCLTGFWLIDRRAGNAERAAAEATSRAIQVDAWARYDDAIAACDRGNIIRQHDAAQNTAIRSIARLSALFLDSSVDLRKALGENLKAQEAADLRDGLKLVAEQLANAPQVDCDVVIRRPSFSRPERGRT